MLESTGDYLLKRANQLGVNRLGVIERCQKELNHRYPGQTRVVSLNQQLLKIVTPNASVAQDLRLRQVELLICLRRLAAPEPINSLNIQIRDLG